MPLDVEVNTDDIAEGYRQAAAGAQKLAAGIDILLPALITIAQGKGEAAKEANSALIAFEEHRGQKLNRSKYMASKARADEVGHGEALHKTRTA